MAIADLPPTLHDKVYSAGVTVSFMPRPSSRSSSSILLLVPSANVKVVLAEYSPPTLASIVPVSISLTSSSYVNPEAFDSPGSNVVIMVF